MAGGLVSFAGRLLPPGVLRRSPVLPAPLSAMVRLAPGGVAAPLPVFSAPAPLLAGRPGPWLGPGLTETVLLVQLLVPDWEGRAVPAQRIGARHRHVLELIQQPGQGTVLGGSVPPHDGLRTRGNGGGEGDKMVQHTHKQKIR